MFADVFEWKPRAEMRRSSSASVSPTGWRRKKKRGSHTRLHSSSASTVTLFFFLFSVGIFHSIHLFFFLPLRSEEVHIILVWSGRNQSWHAPLGNVVKGMWKQLPLLDDWLNEAGSEAAALGGKEWNKYTIAKRKWKRFLVIFQGRPTSDKRLAGTLPNLLKKLVF